MMSRQILIFVLLIILNTTTIVSAVRCHNDNCSISLNYTTDTIIDTTNCTFTVTDACFTSLSIKLHSGEGSFSTYPANADLTPMFLLHNRALDSLTTAIWFRKKLMTQLFTYTCTSDSFCGEDRAQQIYHQAKMLNFDSVWSNLAESLHQSSTNNNPTCMNERNEATTCNGGVCQASFSSESDVITRACVSPRGTVDPTGLIMSTSNAASLQLQSTVIYSCNKDRCNDDTTINRVKQILMDSNLFNTTKPTIISNSAVGHYSCFGTFTFLSLLTFVVWY
ncbi:unnamed protein product [Adineta ricciae]|uniref:Uncharacterized protein n=1 Tax=Adineta ricciae TaxID=249248 RepID=A0A814XKV2_ADIRI|nr:unnamed protein product [Adineta ricciae]CAF1468610.1 unnamed protein product [Adineta ricciae]